MTITNNSLSSLTALQGELLASGKVDRRPRLHFAG